MFRTSTSRLGFGALLIATVIVVALQLGSHIGGFAGPDVRLTTGKSGIADTGPAALTQDAAGGGKAGAAAADAAVVAPETAGKSGVHL